MAAVPQRFYRMGNAKAIVSLQFFGDNRKGTARSGKSGSFRETTKFERYFFGAFNLENGMRYRIVNNKCFISCIVQNDAFVGTGIFNPFGQFFFRGNCSGRIVRETQENQVRPFGGQFRNKAICFVARHVNNSFEIAITLNGTGFARHDCGIGVNRVNRIADGYFVSSAKYFLNVSGIAFRTVGNKYIVSRNVYTTTFIIVQGDCVAQKIVALFGSVTFERFGAGHVVNTFMESLNDLGNQGLGYIANAHADNFFTGIGGFKFAHPSSDFGEQISRLEFQIIFVNQCHRMLF